MHAPLLGLTLTLLGLNSPAIELDLEGELIQGGLVQGMTEPGTKVAVNSTPVRVSPDGLFLVGFGRDEESPVVLELVAPNGKVETRSLEIASRRYKSQRIDGLPPKRVTPDEQALKRIQRESAIVKAARERDDDRTDFLTGFIWPASGPITGVYGSQRILNGEPRRPHFGVDIAAPTGTPVQAPAGRGGDPDPSGYVLLRRNHRPRPRSRAVLRFSASVEDFGDRRAKGAERRPDRRDRALPAG